MSNFCQAISCKKVKHHRCLFGEVFFFHYVGNSDLYVVFTAIEGEGFQFAKWLINGVEVTDESGAVVTDKVALLTIPSGNNTCEIKAVFVTV